MNSLLSLKNLSVQYGKFHALKNLSLEIEQGSIGLLGPNGAGKSTLIKTLLGLLPFTQGEVEILDWNVKKSPLEIRKNVGYVPEGDAYLPGISVVQFLTFLGQLSGMREQDALKRSHEVLEYVGLGEERYRKMEDMTHGQRSRIKLAQALCHDVKLLILDEPTDGMDPVGRENFLSLIKRIRSQAYFSVLLASHTLEDVEYLCDRIILIQEGEILAVKQLSDLIEGKENTYIVDIYGDSNSFLELCKQEGILAEKEIENKVLVYGIQDTQKIFRLACQSKTGVFGMYLWRPTLESMFVKMVKEKKQAYLS